MRIRRDTYDTGGTAIAKEIVHGITSLDAARGTPGVLAAPDPRAMGHRIGPLDPRHRLPPRTPAPATPATARRSWPPCRNIAISLLHLAGITEITRTLQAISRDRNRVLNVIPL